LAPCSEPTYEGLKGLAAFHHRGVLPWGSEPTYEGLKGALAYRVCSCEPGFGAYL